MRLISQKYGFVSAAYSSLGSPNHAFDTISPGPVHVASLTALISYPIYSDVITSHKALADYVATSLSL